MRAFVIMVLILVIVGFAKYGMENRRNLQRAQNAQQQISTDLVDCRTNVFNDEQYAAIKADLPQPDNKFIPTAAQLADNRVPTADERNLLASYHNDILACKDVAMKRMQILNPSIAAAWAPKMKEGNDMMDQLIAGKLTWGEAAHKIENLQQ